MKKSAVFALSVLLLCLCLAGLMLFPAAASRSAVEGLRVCAAVIIPSLLPFLVLSGLICALGLPELLARTAGPVFSALFGLPGAGAAPLVLGLTGGYPVGAAATAELVCSGTLTRSEGERLLPFVNNTGPAFIIGAAGSGVFGSGRLGLLLYLSHIIAAVAAGVLLSRSGHGKISRETGTPRSLPHSTLAAALPACVRSAAGAVVNICAFVVFFSVLRGLLDESGIFPAAEYAISRLTRLDARLIRAVLTGFLELGSGIGAMQGLPASPESLAAASFVLGFGGLSVHCQTLAVTEQAQIKCARHFAGRMLHGALSAVFTFLLSSLLLRI